MTYQGKVHRSPLILKIEKDPELRKKLTKAIANNLPSIEVDGRVYSLEKLSN